MHTYRSADGVQYHSGAAYICRAQRCQILDTETWQSSEVLQATDEHLEWNHPPALLIQTQMVLDLGSDTSLVNSQS